MSTSTPANLSDEEKDLLRTYQNGISDALKFEDDCFAYRDQLEQLSLILFDQSEPRTVKIELRSHDRNEVLENVMGNKRYNFKNIRSNYPNLAKEFDKADKAALDKYFDGDTLKPWRMDRKTGLVRLIAEELPRDLDHQLNTEYTHPATMSKEVPARKSAITINGCTFRYFGEKSALTEKFRSAQWLDSATIVAKEFHKLQQQGAGFYPAITYIPDEMASISHDPQKNTSPYFVNVGDELFDRSFTRTKDAVAYVLLHELAHKQHGDLSGSSPQTTALNKLLSYAAPNDLLTRLNGQDNFNKHFSEENLLGKLYQAERFLEKDGKNIHDFLKELDSALTGVSQQIIDGAEAIGSWKYEAAHAKADNVSRRKYRDFEDLDGPAAAAELEKDLAYQNRDEVREHSFIKRCANLSDIGPEDVVKNISNVLFSETAQYLCNNKLLEKHQWPDSKVQEVLQEVHDILDKHAELMDACTTLDFAVRHIYHAIELRADFSATEKAANTGVASKIHTDKNQEFRAQNISPSQRTHPHPAERAKANSTFAEAVERRRVADPAQKGL